MLPPRRQPSFLDFSDIKIVLKIFQKSDLKSSPRGGPPVRARDLEGVDPAGKEKSSPGLLSSARWLLFDYVGFGLSRLFRSWNRLLGGVRKMTPK